MSSQYSILDNRPIDQWKVTELKEELKRRKLTTRGLKEDLVRRLDEAIRNERELSNEKELDNGFDPEPKLQDEYEVHDHNPEESNQMGMDIDEVVALDDSKNTEDDATTVDVNDNTQDADQETEAQHEESMGTTDLDGTIEEPVPVDLIDVNDSTQDADHETEAQHEESMGTTDLDGTIEEPVPAGMIDVNDSTQDADQETEAQHEESIGTTDLDGTIEELIPAALIDVNDSTQYSDQETEAQHEEAMGTTDLDGTIEEIVPAALTENAITQDGIAPTKSEASSQDCWDGTQNDATTIDTNNNTQNADQQTEIQQEEAIGTTNLDGIIEEQAVPAALAESTSTNDGIAATKSEARSQDCWNSMENVDSESPIEDTIDDQSEPKNQVSEASLNLGFEVKCESISIDSVTINEKNELKDNLNADNFHLELEIVKPEMVQPSSSNVAPTDGDLHSLDSDQEPGDNHGSVKEIDDTSNSTTSHPSQKIDTADGGSPEKLNLDRSSGDESMEEDLLDTKQIESNNISDETGGTLVAHELQAVKEGTSLDGVVGVQSPDDKDAIAKEENKLLVPVEKRKIEDQGSLRTTEPVKRQRRWNAETIKVPEPQICNLSSSSTPKDTSQSTPRRIFTRSDSVLSGDSPKERFVPPSQKTVTTSLRIDRFLRPFTLKAVQELLAKTGTVCSFWMDNIKTHCYVTYSTPEEAVATRNALYNLQWPPNGGRLLTADFVDPQEVKQHVEAPPESPVAISPSPSASTTPSFQKSNASQTPRQASRPLLPPPPSLPPPPPLSQPPLARERPQPPPPPLPPPPPKKPESPVLTLDDLFKKTRATPRIYYLPLSEDQVAAKLAAQGRKTKP